MWVSRGFRLTRTISSVYLPRQLFPRVSRAPRILEERRSQRVVRAWKGIRRAPTGKRALWRARDMTYPHPEVLFLLSFPFAFVVAFGVSGCFNSCCAQCGQIINFTVAAEPWNRSRFTINRPGGKPPRKHEYLLFRVFTKVGEIWGKRGKQEQTRR